MNGNLNFLQTDVTNSRSLEVLKAWTDHHPKQHFLPYRECFLSQPGSGVGRGGIVTASTHAETEDNSLADMRSELVMLRSPESKLSGRVSSASKPTKITHTGISSKALSSIADTVGAPVDARHDRDHHLGKGRFSGSAARWKATGSADRLMWLQHANLLRWQNHPAHRALTSPLRSQKCESPTRRFSSHACALALALARADNSMPAKMAMMVITTNSSMSVKALIFVFSNVDSYL